MNIIRIETFTQNPIGIVRVTAEDGAVGYGQTAPMNADITATVLHRQVAPHYLGRPADAPESLAQTCIEANAKYPGSYVCRALAGVDTALWDLRGVRAGKPVCALLGPAKTHLPAYGSSLRRDITPADEAVRLAALRDSHGFSAFKVRIGKRQGHDQDQWPGRTQALIPAVRHALGPAVRLLVDANSCYTPRKAIEVGHMLEDHGVCHFEEPCPYPELEWTAEVAAALALDVAGGEQDCDMAQFRRLVRLRAVDIVQPDVCYVGGFSRALEVARLAAAAGLPCLPHSANFSLVSVFALHLLAAIPNAGAYMECSIEPPPESVPGLYDPPLEVRAGQIAVPTDPGWGVRILPSWLASAQRQVSQ